MTQLIPVRLLNHASWQASLFLHHIRSKKWQYRVIALLAYSKISFFSYWMITGDPRAREQPLLTLMHTIWVREHNRVANKLFEKFGISKTDEYYYQEARRIVIAEFQHIIDQEYLRVVIGNTFLSLIFLTRSTDVKRK